LFYDYKGSSKGLRWWLKPVIPSTYRSGVQGQPGLHSEALSQKKKKRREEKDKKSGTGILVDGRKNK
jgi:hypothetical protein